MKFFILLLSLVPGILACSDNRSIVGKDLMPEMKLTDSVQIIYFKSPDEPRFFIYADVTDEVFIKALVTDVLAETTIGNDCMKEGKIYCYKKGEIFNTIFFAYLDNECIVLRYIKNGKLYYFKMSEKVKKHLRLYRSISIEPAGK